LDQYDGRQQTMYAASASAFSAKEPAQASPLVPDAKLADPVALFIQFRRRDEAMNLTDRRAILEEQILRGG